MPKYGLAQEIIAANGRIGPCAPFLNDIRSDRNHLRYQENILDDPVQGRATCGDRELENKNDCLNHPDTPSFKPNVCRMKMEIDISRPHSSGASPLKLSECPLKWRGTIVGLAAPQAGGCDWPEFERRLLEMGFVEGARVEIRHEGPIGRDPIAVVLDHTLIALRRRDAAAVLVRTLDDEVLPQ